MKRNNVLLTATLVTSLVFSGNSVFAENETPINIKGSLTVQNNKVDASDYMKFTGVISNVNQDGKTLTLTVEDNENSNLMIFPISDDVLLLDSGKAEKMLKEKMIKGLKVDVYYDKNKPMPLIYPATITPDIIIVQGEEMGQVKVSKFDKNLISLDNDLKLHISKETILLNEDGEHIQQEDLYEKELIVFYSISTKSIPAQTTPKKVIALDQTEGSLRLEIENLINEDYYMKNETKMIPIRKVAEHLGYEVKWRGKKLGVFVSKQNSSFQIKIGQKKYGYNRSLRYFEEAPELKNGKTYVSEGFVELLLMK